MLAHPDETLICFVRKHKTLVHLEQFVLFVNMLGFVLVNDLRLLLLFTKWNCAEETVRRIALLARQ